MLLDPEGGAEAEVEVEAHQQPPSLKTRRQHQFRPRPLLSLSQSRLKILEISLWAVPTIPLLLLPSRNILAPERWPPSLCQHALVPCRTNCRPIFAANCTILYQKVNMSAYRLFGCKRSDRICCKS